MCSVCTTFEERMAAGNVFHSFGPVAQLVEHLHGMEGAARSSRVGSTLSELSPWALGGFVAGEGTFVDSPLGKTYADGTPRRRFVFQVTVASRDRAMLDALRAYLGFGSIQSRAPAREHWQPTSDYTV